jgi:diguanylate cyclase (GGDEF)-like protein/PAS domain S-box-containing protein
MTSNILIVDDRPTNLRIYAQFLTMMGEQFRAITYANPQEALDWLAHNAIDLMIVDYRMPEMNGVEFIKRARASVNGQSVPAIIITAHQDRECRLSALDSGATDFLQSPVSHVEFCKRATTLLRHYQKSNQIREKAITAPHGRAHAQHEQNTAHGLNGKSMLEQIIDTIPIMITATDRAGKCLFTNAYQAALYNRTPGELVGKDIGNMSDPDYRERERRRDQLVLQTKQPIANFEEKMQCDGVDMIFHCNKSPLLNHENEAVGVLTTAVDITARKFAENHRTHMALHDMLTGLPNRVLLAEKVGAAIERCKESGTVSALLLLDLDRFKIINDTRGHQSGDSLLREVADRLAAYVANHGFVSRIGGDEFALILDHIVDADDINSRCLRLLQAIAKPYSIGGVEQAISASIGITMIPEDGDQFDELLRLADLAMYEAKATGRNGHCFYSERLNHIAQTNAALEIELREALEKQQFALEYQPIVDAQTLEYTGLEALIRWDHPVRGRLLPAQFIRVAEDAGLMDTIGTWVIGEACRQIASFANEGVILPRVAVNISPRQFQNQHICSEILDNIQRYNIPASRFVVEITEEILIDNNDHVRASMARLRANGVGISIDDFGTGYSSLQYLRDLPATCLKIDRTFVSRIEKSSADRAIIGTIAHLAHSLGMKVIAEGVENEGQLDLLRVAGCDEIQGFKIARPLHVNVLRDLFAGGKSQSGRLVG